VSTIREQIVAAAVIALNTSRPIGVPAAVRTRVDSPAADQLPALTVFQALETVKPMFDERPGRASVDGPVVRRYVDIAIEALTKAGSGNEPDKAADPLLAWASKALGSVNSLGGVAKGPAKEQGTQFNYEQGETSFCRATMTVRVPYQTRSDNAELVA